MYRIRGISHYVPGIHLCSLQYIFPKRDTIKLELIIYFLDSGRRNIIYMYNEGLVGNTGPLGEGFTSNPRRQDRVSEMKKRKKKYCSGTSLLMVRRCLAAEKKLTAFYFPEQCSCPGYALRKQGLSLCMSIALGFWSCHREKKAIKGACNIKQAARN